MSQQIQPVSSWQNGEEKQATIFDLRIVNDNLSTSATFYYSLSSAEVYHMETRVVAPEIPAYDEVVDGKTIHHDAVPEVTIQVKVVDEYSVMLVDGNLSIDGQDYQTWDSDPSANAFAYNYAMIKLKLVPVS